MEVLWRREIFVVKGKNVLIERQVPRGENFVGG